MIANRMGREALYAILALCVIIGYLVTVTSAADTSGSSDADDDATIDIPDHVETSDVSIARARAELGSAMRELAEIEQNNNLLRTEVRRLEEIYRMEIEGRQTAQDKVMKLMSDLVSVRNLDLKAMKEGDPDGTVDG